jgi:hypothetical protein
MQHRKSSRRVRTCECGRKFMPSEKFGNEKHCDACYERSQEAHRAWFDSLSDEEQEEVLQDLCDEAAKLGVETKQAAHDAARRADILRRLNDAPVDVQDVAIVLLLEHILAAMKDAPPPTVEESPEQVAHVDQNHIDRIAAELLTDIDM